MATLAAKISWSLKSMFRDSSLSGQKFVSAAGLGWSKCDALRALLLARRRVEHDVVT